MQAISELSILYSTLTSWFGGRWDIQLLRIKSLLVDFLGDPKVAEWVRKLPTYYSAYVIGYLALRGSGVRLPEFEEALDRLHRARYPNNLEMTPYRDLELQHMMWKAGIIRRQPGCNAAFRRTTLHRCDNPIHFSLAEVYSITHTLFYVTGFAGPATNIPPRVRERAIQVVELLLVHYWRQADWDVTSELLLNMVALDRFKSAFFKDAFKAVMDAWRPDGILPGPAVASLAADATRKEVFESCYHTTLVGLLLCGGYLYRATARGPKVRNGRS